MGPLLSRDHPHHKAVVALIRRHFPNVAPHIRVEGTLGNGALAEIRAHLDDRLPPTDPRRLAVDRELESHFAHVDSVKQKGK